MATRTNAGAVIARNAANKRHSNQSGQLMGSKGLRKRRQIIHATSQLLETRSIRDLQAVDIAVAADTSASTFYLYFDDVPDAVLAAVGDLSQSSPTILRLLEEPWTPQNATDFALALVLEHIDYWDRHHALLRVRNLAAEEGDARFLRTRTLSLEPLLSALSRQVGRQQAAGRIDARFSPLAIAGVTLAMLDRIGAAMNYVRERKQVSERQIVRSTAHVIVEAMGLHQPSPSATARRDDQPAA